jgi:single-stranded-DNA-specific exonuclease
VELIPHLDIDALVTLPELGGDTFMSNQMLAPFGRGNPSPVLLSRGTEVVDCRAMGNGEEHLRLTLRQGGILWDAVGFRLGCHRAEITPCIDIVYNLEVDRWRGEDRLRLNLLDFAPSA